MELGTKKILWMRYVPTYNGNRALSEEQRLSVEIKKMRSVDILAQSGWGQDDAIYAWRDEALKAHLENPEYGPLIKQVPADILRGMRQFIEHTKGFRNFVFDGEEASDATQVFLNLAGTIQEEKNLIAEIQEVIKKTAELEGEELKNFFWQCDIGIPEKHCRQCAGGRRPLYCAHPSGADRLVRLGQDAIYTHCPGLTITQDSLDAVRLFRLMHHRSPDLPGERWHRTAPQEMIDDLPVTLETAFPLMEIETYRLGQEAEQRATNVATIKQNLEVFINAKNNAGGAFKGLQGDVDKTFGKKGGGGLIGMSGAATAAIGAATVGIGAMAAGITSSVKVAADFEQSMAKVKAITGATGDSFDKLEGLAKTLGSTTSFSASEAAEGIQFLGMAGLTTDEIMTALPDTLSLASAGAMDLGTAADIASNIMSGMGLELSDLTHVADGLAQAARKSNTDVTQLGEGFKYVATTASQAGLDFDQTTAALGMLANAGLQGSMGGTSLNNALSQMIKPSGEAEKAAKRLGLQFLDNNGKIRPLVDITKDLEDANVSAKDMLILFGQEGGRAMGALKQQGSTALAGLNKSLKESGGTAEQMAKVQMGTFQGALKGLSSATEGLQIAIGEKFLPILTTMVKDYLTPAVQKFGEWADVIDRIDLGAALDSVVAFGEGAFEVVDSFFSDPEYRRKFIRTISGIFRSASTLVGNFLKSWSVLVTNWAGFVWEPIGQAFDIMWGVVKQATAPALNWVGEKFTAGINAIIRTINTVGEVFGVTITEIDFTPITVEAPKSVAEAWDEVKTNNGKRLDAMSAAFTQMGDDIGADSKALVTEVTKSLGVMEEGAGGKFEKVTTAFTVATAKPIVKSANETGVAAGKALALRTGNEAAKTAPAAADQFLGVWKDKLANVNLETAMSVADGLMKGMDILTSDQGTAAKVEAIGMQIGQSIGGKAGAAISLAVTAGAKLYDSIFGEKSGSESRASAIGNLERAIDFGNIQGFSAFNNLDRATDKHSSAATTIQAIAGLYGISNEDAAALIALLRDPDRLAAGGPEVERLNALLGATENRGLVAIASGIATDEKSDLGKYDVTAAASGYSGTVAKPTLFLAGEAGPEDVQITPQGGFKGSMGGTNVFQFTINTLDPRGMKELIEGELGDWIMRRIKNDSADNRELMFNGGLINAAVN